MLTSTLLSKFSNKFQSEKSAMFIKKDYAELLTSHDIQIPSSWN